MLPRFELNNLILCSSAVFLLAILHGPASPAVGLADYPSDNHVWYRLLQCFDVRFLFHRQYRLSAVD